MSILTRLQKANRYNTSESVIVASNSYPHDPGAAYNFIPCKKGDYKFQSKAQFRRFPRAKLNKMNADDDGDDCTCEICKGRSEWVPAEWNKANLGRQIRRRPYPQFMSDGEKRYSKVTVGAGRRR